MECNLARMIIMSNEWQTPACLTTRTGAECCRCPGLASACLPFIEKRKKKTRSDYEKKPKVVSQQQSWPEWSRQCSSNDEKHFHKPVTNVAAIKSNGLPCYSALSRSRYSYLNYLINASNSPFPLPVIVIAVGGHTVTYEHTEGGLGA